MLTFFFRGNQLQANHNDVDCERRRLVRDSVGAESNEALHRECSNPIKLSYYHLVVICFRRHDD